MVPVVIMRIYLMVDICRAVTAVIIRLDDPNDNFRAEILPLETTR
jgi:hypothetical protein